MEKFIKGKPAGEFEESISKNFLKKNEEKSRPYTMQNLSKNH